MFGVTSCSAISDTEHNKTNTQRLGRAKGLKGQLWLGGLLRRQVMQGVSTFEADPGASPHLVTNQLCDFSKSLQFLTSAGLSVRSD